MFLAIEAAFCSAERVTIAGSISPVMASRPWPFLGLRASLTMTEPSIFGLCAIRRSGSSSARSAMYAPSRPPSGTRRDGRRSQPAARCRHRDRCPARAPRGRPRRRACSPSARSRSPRRRSRLATPPDSVARRSCGFSGRSPSRCSASHPDGRLSGAHGPAAAFGVRWSVRMFVDESASIVPLPQTLRKAGGVPQTCDNSACAFS